MKLQHRIFAAVLSASVTGLVLTGCDDPNASAVRPTTNPSAVAAKPEASADSTGTAAAYPITPLTPPSMLTIDGREVAFPPAKLAVIGRGSGSFMLRLCSDDPPTAIDPGYAGNSYVVDMRLPIDRLTDLPGSTWDYRESDSSDSNSGIFLHGFREQLHPCDLHVLFQKEKDSPSLMVSINGSCLRNDSKNPAAPSVRVTVSGYLRMAEPE